MKNVIEKALRENWEAYGNGHVSDAHFESIIDRLNTLISLNTTTRQIAVSLHSFEVNVLKLLGEYNHCQELSKLIVDRTKV